MFDVNVRNIRPAVCLKLSIDPTTHRFHHKSVPLYTTNARAGLVSNTMVVCDRITFASAVEVVLCLYFAAISHAWDLDSMADSFFAVATSSAGGLFLCLASMLWRKFRGQPVPDSLATPVMLLAEGLYQDDQCLLDSAATLLPIQFMAIVLWVLISPVGASLEDFVFESAAVDVLFQLTVWYCCWALLCRYINLSNDGRSNRFVYPVDNHEVLKFATPKALRSSVSSRQLACGAFTHGSVVQYRSSYKNHQRAYDIGRQLQPFFFFADQPR